MTDETIKMKLGEPKRKFEGCFATFGCGETYKDEEAMDLSRVRLAFVRCRPYPSTRQLGITPRKDGVGSQRAFMLSQALVDSRRSIKGLKINGKQRCDLAALAAHG